MTWLDNLGLEQPTANEFLAQPDLRQISTFFLGSTFIVSLYYLSQSRPALYLRQRIDGILAPRAAIPPRPALDLEAGSISDEKVVSGLAGGGSAPVATWNRDPMHFVFFLTLCALIASLTQFLSLLAYGSRADVACAFVVAWGGMASQCIRLFGLLKISFVLQDFGARRWEIFTFWGMLCVAVVLMLFTGATSVGTVKGLDALPALAFCYRKHLLLSGLLSALVNILLEAYSIVRLFVLSVPPFLKLHHQFQALIDIRLGWGASLLLLDLLTLVPSLVPITIAADFVPFSIGALVVLYAFNRVVPPPVSDIDTMTIPETIAVSLPPGDDAGPVSRFEGESTNESADYHTGNAGQPIPGPGAHPQAGASASSLESVTWPAPPPAVPAPAIRPQDSTGRSRAIFPGQSQYIPPNDFQPYARHEHFVPPPPRGYKPDIRIEIPGSNMPLPPPAPPRAMVIEQRSPPDTSASSIKYGSDIIAGSTRNAMKRHSATSSAPEFASNSRDSTFSSPASVYPYGAYGTPGIMSPSDDRSEVGYLSPGSDIPRTTLSSKRLTFGKSPRPSGPRDLRPRPPPLEPVAGQKRAAPGSDAPPPSAAAANSSGPLSAFPRSETPRLSVSIHTMRRKSVGPHSKRSSHEPSRRMTMRFNEDK